MFGKNVVTLSKKGGTSRGREEDLTQRHAERSLKKKKNGVSVVAFDTGQPGVCII